MSGEEEREVGPFLDLLGPSDSSGLALARLDGVFERGQKLAVDVRTAGARVDTDLLRLRGRRRRSRCSEVRIAGEEAVVDLLSQLWGGFFELKGRGLDPWVLSYVGRIAFQAELRSSLQELLCLRGRPNIP